MSTMASRFTLIMATGYVFSQRHAVCPGTVLGLLGWTLLFYVSTSSNSAMNFIGFVFSSIVSNIHPRELDIYSYVN